MLRQAQHERFLGLGFALVLAACSQSPDNPAANKAAEASAEHVDCALAGAAAYKPDCTVERSAASLILRHPDGGFRRFELGSGDNRIRPADGAEAAQWRDLPGGQVEVVVGQDRYRLRLQPEPSDGPSTGLPQQ